jgi:branched-subunit amino acid aminotransferase/4-amino-4-deoxychorismate lyase
MLRTFAGRPFRVQEHLERLFRSAERSFIRMRYTADEIGERVEQVVRYNHKLLPAGHDLGVIVFATAGPNPTYLGRWAVGEPGMTCVHTFPLPFELWAERFESGQELVIPPILADPGECLDPIVKSRSRLHWYVADRLARTQNPAASAILVNRFDELTETSSGNFFAVLDGVLRTPAQNVLPGISRQYVMELSAALGLPCEEARLKREHLQSASEAFTTSTPYCMMPVRSVDGRLIGDGRPGPVFRRLLAAWSDAVGIDVAEQMRHGAADQ